MSEELSFRERVWLVVSAIPYGQVATYGDVARLAGNEKAARQVGGVLGKLPEGSALPWHRVVNREGRISLGGSRAIRQLDALLAENIDASLTRGVALHKYRWSGC